MQESYVSSIAAHSPKIIDETTRGFLAQAIRDAFTSSSIDHNEECLNSLISKVDKDILQAHLSSQDSKAGESPLRTTGSALQTPPASPHRGRGSYRILNAQKMNYASLAGAEPRKRRKRQISKPLEQRGDESTSDRIADVTEVCYQSINQRPLPDDDPVNGAHPLNLPINTFSSYQSDSAFTMRAIASILFECFTVNSAIARYGHRTTIALTRTDPNKIRKYAEVAEYDYEQAVSIIQRDSALAMGKGVQNRYN